MKRPRAGAIARCSMGALGLITANDPKKVTYSDGKEGLAWVGIHLTNTMATIGSPWSSRKPQVLAYIDDLGKEPL